MMEAILNIAEQVRARVEESHAETLTRAFDVLDRRIDLIAQHAQRCSYGAVLGSYTDLNITIHHCKKVLDERGFFEQFNSRLEDAERRVRGLRVGMYENVCLTCPACKSRRKPWPLRVKFAHMNEAVRDITSVNRMVLRYAKEDTIGLHSDTPPTWPRKMEGTQTRRWTAGDWLGETAPLSKEDSERMVEFFRARQQGKTYTGKLTDWSRQTQNAEADFKEALLGAG